MRKRTFVLWKKILKWTLIFLAVFSILYLYFSTNIFTIHHYSLIGVPEELRVSVEQEIATMSAQPLYGFIPANKMLSLRKEKIKEIIRNTLPNTSKISMRIVPLHTLKITVTPHVPLFKLDEKRAVTKDGYLYEEIKSLDDLPIILVASSTTVLEKNDGFPKNKLVIENATNTEDLFSGIAGIIPKINAVLFNVAIVTIHPRGDVVLSDKSGVSSVKLTSLVNMEKEWSNVISAIDTEPLKTLLEKKKEKLEYIDVRFGNKVFYKFTNTATPAIIPVYATSTASTTPR